VVPNIGPLPYCGLQGFVSLMKNICRNNDMGHPLFDNFRAGAWALDYTTERLDKYLPTFPALRETVRWLKTVFAFVKELPNYLVPRYATLIFMTTYHFAAERAFSLMSNFVQQGEEFTQGLALGSIQLYGSIKSTSLFANKEIPAMAAGLPHFATQYMRCWGRDTFIALRGLMITTGRFDVAKKHILAFGSCLRHGLIPNLLDSGRNPRYNCRDAAWWFLQAIQDYCMLSPEGAGFLNTKMERRFPTDDFNPGNNPSSSSYLFSVKDCILEILTRHANGIHFRERNAGGALDSNMSDAGFNVDIFVDWFNTGFVFGGNDSNCGTWMDKMGESEKAKTKGIPATPRDGAAIEIIGLLKSTLRWLIHIDFSPNGVEIQSGDDNIFKSFKEWNDLILHSFEKHFYVPKDPKEDWNYMLRAAHINRRGIYKDTYGSTHGWTDYQFRPNFLVAMVVAPELFYSDKAKGRYALELAEKHLLGPLGIKTLDPSDFNYRGNYDNANDSEDPKIAKGFNYHQGPEWLWCTGYFLRAYIRFSTDDISDMTLTQVHRFMRRHREMLLKESLWAALPELTNENGAHCPDSCPSQAWSFATLLDTLYELHFIENKLPSKK